MIKLQVIGYPIKHSLSPIMHSAVMDYLKVSYEYEKIEVTEVGLKEYVSKVKQEGITGFNVTMPHKQNIIQFLDSVDKEALLCNAVNTVHNEEGKLYGYNTDGNRFHDVIGEK